MIGAIVIDVAVVLAICTLGALISFLVLRKASRLELLSLSFPIGAGALTWIFFVLGWIGLPFRLTTVILVWSLSIIFLLTLRRWNYVDRQLNGASVNNSKTRGISTFDKAAFVFLVLISLTSIYISIGRSYSTYDAVAMWAPKGYGIALEESLWGAKWGGSGFAYPLNIHFLIGIFRITSGDILPGSKIIFSIFFVSLIAGVSAFLIKRGVDQRIIALSAIILATVPILFLHSTIGYANLPMGVYLVLGALWGVDGIFRESKRHQMLSGVMLGFAVWTILEGGLFVVSAVLAIVCAKLIVRKGRIYFIHWLFPIAIIGGIWVIFYKLYGGSGSSAISATQLLLDSIFRGEWDFPVLRLIFGYARRNIFDPQTWGFIYPVGFLLTLLGWKYLLPKNDRYVFSIFLVTISTGFLALGLIYLRSFVIQGLYDLLERGFPRYFISPSIFFFLVAILIAGDLISDSSKEENPQSV